MARPKSLDQVGLPAELTRQAIPSDNLQTPEKIALGEKLFFDGRLSADGTVACSTCHDPARAFTDGRPVSIGINGRAGQRNAPTIAICLAIGDGYGLAPDEESWAHCSDNRRCAEFRTRAYGRLKTYRAAMNMRKI
jgi:hypothetical protein